MKKLLLLFGAVTLLFAACTSSTDDGKRNLIDEIANAKAEATIDVEKFDGEVDKKGDYTINAKGLTITNMKLSEASLTVSEEVADGSFTFKDGELNALDIEGGGAIVIENSTLDTLYIDGGASVSIKNCTIKNLVVRENDVKVTLSGATKIETEMKIEADGCTLDADGTSNSIAKITLSASVKKLTIDASDKSSLNISNITVDKPSEEEAAVKVTITVKNSDAINIEKVDEALKGSIKDEAGNVVEIEQEPSGDDKKDPEEGGSGGNTGNEGGNTGSGETGEGAGSEDEPNREFKLSDLRINGNFGSGVWEYDNGLSLVEDTDGTYYYEFMALKSAYNFSLRPDNIWSNAYRMTSDGVLNDAFATGELDKEVELFRGDEAAQMPLSVSEGVTYRIVVTEGDFASIKVKIVKVADAILMNAVFDNGTTILLKTISDSIWRGIFEATDAGDYLFYVQSGDVYYDKEGNPSETKPVSKNVLSDCSMNTPYEIIVEKKGETISVTYEVYDTSVIGQGAFVGTISGLDYTGTIKCAAYKVSEDKDKGIYTYEYNFTANAKKLQFAIQKIAGGWDDRWCGEANFNACINSGSSAIPGGGKVKMGRYNGGNPSHFILTDMILGNEYTICITVEKNDKMIPDGADVYIELIGERAVEKPFEEEIREFRIIGIFTGWKISDEPEVSSDGLTMTFGPFVAKDPETAGNKNNPWGFCSDEVWSTKYTGASLVLGGEAETLIEANDLNNTVIGLAAGDKFNIVITIDENLETVSASAMKVQ